MLTVGHIVPDFSYQATHQQQGALRDLQGRALVLYFYPKDNTPGCTRESEDFRDAYPQFTEHHTQIMGVSRDSLASHEKFKAKLQLPFELISDADEVICQLFDVIKLKNMYGKQVRGIERSTFLIDRAGILQRQWRKVKVPGHVSEVFEAARQLN